MRTAITDRLRAGDLLILDGATGTELEMRGVDCSSAIGSAVANLEAPDLLRAVHADYLNLGADIITANNFSTGPASLEKIGQRDRWKEYSSAGLEIAISMRDEINPNAYVAGGVHPGGTFGDEFSQRVQLLSDLGVDIILAEAVNTVSDCIEVARASSEFELPLFMGIGNLREDGSLEDGTEIQVLVEALGDFRIDALMLMDSFPPSISAALPRAMKSFAGPVGVYPHCGLAHMAQEDGEPSGIAYSRHYTPDQFARFAAAWQSGGAQIIGGCCGAGPDHIRAFVQQL